MKALMIKGVNTLEVTDVPEPTISPKEVLARVKYVGICETDRELLWGQHPATKHLIREKKEISLIPGHEWSGEVIRVGNDCKNVKIGDRIVAETSIPCDNCYYCKSGRPNLCASLQEVGIDRNGAMAEYISVPEKIVHKIPDNLAFREATLIEPTAVAVHAVNRALEGIDKMDSLAEKSAIIFGDGPIGLLTFIAAKEMLKLHKLSIVGKNHEKLNVAKELGCDLCINTYGDLGGAAIYRIKQLLKPITPDIVFEAVGNKEVINETVGVVGKGGTVVFIGLTNTSPIDMEKVVFKELTLKGSISSPHVWDKAIEILISKRRRVTKLITDELTLEGAVEFLKNKKEDTIKAVINISD
jgi:threonine dehydrogenase-like Zn-dependent dehydrogenase